MRWTIGVSRPQAVEVAGSGSGSHRSEEERAETRNQRPMFCSLQNVDRRSKRCGSFVSRYLVRIPELGIKGIEPRQAKSSPG